MIPLYTIEEYSIAKASDKLPCQCYVCNITFHTQKRLITQNIKHNLNKVKFCSKKCEMNLKRNKIKLICSVCYNEFERIPHEIKKNKTNFCSRSCKTTYQNAHKSSGFNRSKLEKYLESKLTLLYPNLIIEYNKTDAINAELDIFIPSLKLAFELNGIFHYEPIFGLDKLNKTQKTDSNKFQRCQEQNISLCVIDTSSQKYFKESTSQKYLDIITDIINQRTSC
jgi:hypothetical protein